MDNSQKIRVLLVDDEEDFLASTAAVLARRGFVVDTAPNGHTALDKIDVVDYDAVVLDVKMPGINGIEVLGHIHDEHPGVTVLLLTGHSSISDAFRSAKLGISRYLSKPIEMGELAGQIRAAVAESSGNPPPGTHKEQTEDVTDAIRVTLVDDETDFLESTARLLRRRNINVSTATSGEDALALLAHDPVDIVVLDLRMPGLGGRWALEKIKRDYPRVKVIVLTGHPSVKSAIEAIRLGASEYMEKPPIMEDLVEAIRRLYKLSRQEIIEQQRNLIEEIRHKYPD